MQTGTTQAYLKTEHFVLEIEAVLTSRVKGNNADYSTDIQGLGFFCWWLTDGKKGLNNDDVMQGVLCTFIYTLPVQPGWG